MSEYRHRVVAISGSMKLYRAMVDYATKLSMAGDVVLLPFRDTRKHIEQSVKDMYDSLHNQRIDMADVLAVITSNGYIGKSVEKEIEYAQSTGKEIRYVSVDEPKEDNKDNSLGFSKVITICGSMKFKDIMLQESLKLTAEGALVYLPPMENLVPEVCAEKMRKRILKSDEIYVINNLGYIGENTRKNIAFANNHNKVVKYYDEMSEWLRNKVVTLCGSVRFADEFRDIKKQLSKEGIIVLTPAIFDYSELELQWLTESDHMNLDKIHQWKMDVADVIMIVNPSRGNGYVGKDTRKEIEYARSQNKIIKFMSNTDQNGNDLTKVEEE